MWGPDVLDPADFARQQLAEAAMQKKWGPLLGLPDQSLPEGAHRPSNTLPGQPNRPDNNLPGVPNLPDNALPGGAHLPDNTLPGVPNLPDNALPDAPARPDNTLPTPPNLIDNTLPGARPGIDNTLPTPRPGIDNSLPSAPNRPGHALPEPPDVAAPTEQGLSIATIEQRLATDPEWWSEALKLETARQAPRKGALRAIIKTMEQEDVATRTINKVRDLLDEA